MGKIEEISGDLTVRDAHIAIAAARFNGFIVDQLRSGCVDTLERHGITADRMTVVQAPGAFELPLVCKRLAASRRYDAVIALGAVIRGSTPHFEYVAGGCAHGLAGVAMEFDLPVAFGVLTVDNIEQAVERAGTKAGNKGADAALTALEMISLMRHLDRE